MEWIQVYSGASVYVTDMSKNNSENILIEDIAHGTSMQCRFNGHIKEFYSVAQHSVHVADMVYKLTGSKKLAFEGLMHDSSEAYLADLPRPVKRALPSYKDMELVMEKRIAEIFGYDFPLNSIMVSGQIKGYLLREI